MGWRSRSQGEDVRTADAGSGLPERRAVLLGGGTAAAAIMAGATFGRVPMAAAATINDGLSVTDFGATGDGVTDDAPAIQACIDASKPGDCIFFPSTGAAGGSTVYLVRADIRLTPNRTYASAMGQPGPFGVEIKYADGVNGVGVLISNDYARNSQWCGYPIHIVNLRINGNRANNTSGHGVVLMNFNSRIQSCFVTECAGDGVHLSDVNSQGTLILNSCVEQRIAANKINNCSGNGIMVLDTGRSGKLTDGYCTQNIVSNIDGDSIHIARAAGWFILENHVYKCQRDGIVVGALWNTYLVNNEVDQFGEGPSGGTFNGFRVESILDGRPSVISGNVASTREVASRNYRYYSFRNAWNRNNSFIQFWDNKLHRHNAAGTVVEGLHLNPNGGVLHFYDQGSMLEGLPTTIVPDGTCHRYNPTGQILGYMETLDRDAIDPTSASPSPQQGSMYLTYFTANQFMQVTQLATASRGTAGAGATLARMGLYEIDPLSGDGRCIARTASDPTMWQQSESTYTRAVSDDGHGGSISSVDLVQGRRYAFALLHVGSSTAPTLAGKSGIGGLAAGASWVSRRSGYLPSQSDLPPSFSGSVVGANESNGDYFYGRLT